MQEMPNSSAISGHVSGNAREIPSTFYYVGDIIDLWGSWELVVHDGARVVPAISENPKAFLDMRDGVRECASEIEEAGILVILATLTRIGAPDQAGRHDGVAWHFTSLSVYGANGQVMNGHNIFSVDVHII